MKRPSPLAPRPSPLAFQVLALALALAPDLARAAPPPAALTPYTRSLIATSSTPAQARNGLGIVHGTNTAFNNLQFATDTEWRIINGALVTNLTGEVPKFSGNRVAASNHVDWMARGTNSVDLLQARDAYGASDPTNQVARGDNSFLGAGIGNETTNNASAVVAGTHNKAFGSISFIGAGQDCLIYGGGGFMGAGNDMLIGGGVYNFIGGGTANIINESLENGDYNFIGGGSANNISTESDFNFIGGGNGNTITGGTNAVLAGQFNSVTAGFEATAIGSRITNDLNRSVKLGYGQTNLWLTTTGAVLNGVNFYAPILYATGAVVVAQSDAYLSNASITNKLNVAAGKTNHMLINTNGVLLDIWSDGWSVYSKALAP